MRNCMKFLIDTNVFIPLEPVGMVPDQPWAAASIELARVVSETGSQLYVHPVQREDIARDRDPKRRRLRERLFGKYPALPHPPGLSDELIEALGASSPGTHDWVDDHLLAALCADAVDYLVTEDTEIHRKAARLGLAQRVARVAEAVSVLRDLFDKTPRPPPAVCSTVAHDLDARDPIFESLRSDYPGFDQWLSKCKRQHRRTWVIEGESGELAGLCIVKREESAPHLPESKILKICTIKIAVAHNGFRYGELLLKAILRYARTNAYEWLYLTVLPRHSHLRAFLADFGFEDAGQNPGTPESVFAKPLRFTEAQRAALDPLAFNVRFGPFACKMTGVPTFVVPIRPQYHQLLFPDAERQMELLPAGFPFGNSIRKAYLSRGAIRSVAPGSNLLFYRSEDVRGVTGTGVVEGTFVSSSANEIARFVGKRTVYSFAEIEAMCDRDVLAILFRHSGIVRPAIHLDALIRHGVLAAHPQSIVTVPEEATRWLQERLDG